MRVMMLTDYFPPHAGGGVERVVFELARSLVQRDLSVGVITLDTRGAPREEVVEGVRVWRLGAYSLTGLLGLQSAFSPTILGDALRICRKFAPDVIHAHNIFFMTSLAGPVLRWSLSRPLVTSLHLGPLDRVPGVSGALARLYETVAGRWLLKHSDRVLAVGQSVREHGLDLGVSPEKIQTIPNTVAVPSGIHPRPSSSARPRVVFVGRLVVNKGPHIFLRAAIQALANSGGAEFLLVGEGPLRSRLESEVRRRDLTSHIRFLGFRDDVFEILETATIFVRPSLLEGYPLSVLEAMACDVPVIASDIPGNADVVRHAETGILTEAGDVDALSTAMTTLLGDAETRRRLATRARAAIARHPDWDMIGDQLVTVYRGLLGDSSPAHDLAGSLV